MEVIRLAAVADAEPIAALITRVAAKYILPEFSPEGQARFLADHRPETVARRMETGFCYHVAEASGDLVGVVGVRDGSHLFHLFVDELSQGRGLGRALWERARARCLAEGNPGIFTVNSSRNAVPVYERFGFLVAAPVQDAGGVLFVPMKRVLAPHDETASLRNA
jgi:GNAT superfamily N-acetyltransferase